MVVSELDRGLVLCGCCHDTRVLALFFRPPVTWSSYLTWASAFPSVEGTLEASTRGFSLEPDVLITASHRIAFVCWE